MGAAALWARSEVRRGWLSLLVVSLLVAITGGAVMAGVAGARRAGAAVDRYMADSRPSDITIYTQTPLDPAVRTKLEGDPRVGAVANMNIVLVTPTALQPGLEGSTIVVPDSYWGDLTRPRLVAGRYPTGADEIAVTEQEQKAGGYEIGQQVDLHMLSPSAAQTCIGGGDCTPTSAGRATITAVLRMPSDLAPGPFSQGLFVAPRAFLSSHGGEESSWGTISDVFLHDHADVDGVVGDYSVLVDNGDVSNATGDDVVGAIQATDLQRNALLIGSAIAAAAGLLIAGQAFGRFLTRRSSDAATLAAIGMPSGQRTLAGFLPGLVAAVLGATLAIPVAIALSPFFPLRVARRADPDVGVHADWYVLTIGFAVVALIGTAAALVSASLWSRHRTGDPRTASVSFAAGVAERLHLGPAPAMGSRFALEPGSGARRAPVVPSLIGAAVAVVVMVGALVISSSLDGLLSTPERYGATWNLQAAAGKDYDTTAARIAQDDRIEGASLAVTGELTLAANGNTPTQGFTVGVKSVKGSVEPVVLAGRVPVGSNEILVGSTTMRRQHVAIGDQVTISGPKGSQEVIVVGRAIIPVISTSSPDEGMVVPLDTFLQLGGTDTVANVDVEAAVLATARPADLAGVGHDIETAGARLDGPFRQSTVTSLGEVRGIPLYVALFTALIGTLAVFHALFVTGRRRRGDLAVLRALGYRPRQASNVINWQGFFLALASLVIGVPVGLIAGRLLWNAIATNTNVANVIDTPWLLIAGFGVIALAGATFVLAAGPAWSARRHPPALDLRAE